jgi:hypothetical protein
MPLLTCEQAAKRVRKDVNTIKRWRRSGLGMTKDSRGRTVVDEALLLAWWRDRMANDPVHQARMRRAAIDAGLAMPLVPKRAPRRDPADDDEELAARRQPPVEPSPKLRGEAEYKALHDALKRSEPASRDDDAFTADAIVPDGFHRLAAICARCDVLEQCRAFAEASGPAVGVWAGMVAGRRGLSNSSDAALDASGDGPAT